MGGSVNRNADIPLCVGLEGALVKADLGWEAIVLAVKRNPLLLLMLPFWLASGGASRGRKTPAPAAVDAALLPYSEELLTYLRQEKESGRPVILVSAAPPSIAHGIAEHLGIFDEVISHSHEPRAEVRARALAGRFGEGGFDYAGSGVSDLPVWQVARRPIVVHSSRGLALKLGTAAKNPIVISPRKAVVHGLVGSIRPAQWTKNTLLFVPLIAAHKIHVLPLVREAVIAFFAFSLAASSNYLLNDLLDLASDRGHQVKRRRPAAAGEVPVSLVLAMAGILLAGALLLALLLPRVFCAWLLLYVVVTLGYSLRLRRYMLLDIVALACLYTLRVVAGGAATGIPLSYWLLTFSLFMFTSLALVKRCSELAASDPASQARIGGRGYCSADFGLLRSMGIASGYLAVLVIALYVNSPDTTALYSRPTVLWLMCPLVLYWVSRIWILAGRGRVLEDPVDFALRDVGSILVVGASALVIAAAL
jgi:4-hydroxybenzoate polyprenyltransferase